ncbi:MULTISPECIES: anti-sigma factor [Corynebacterium]|uniref:anti-sigma factor n=1 Tax=Corynebacterium TaxID=1716 RepID=UPI00124E85C3|nr:MULTISPECIES: anti-sigma factor [Corynebacterium]
MTTQQPSQEELEALATLSALGSLPLDEQIKLGVADNDEFIHLQQQYRDVLAGLSADVDMPDAQAAWERLRRDIAPVASVDTVAPPRRWLPLLLASASAVMVLVIGTFTFTTMNASSDRSETDQAEVSTSERQVAGGTVTVEYAPGADTAKVMLRDVPAPPPDQAYQMWLVEDSGPRSVGVMESAEVLPEMDVELDGVAQAQSIMISQEPAGGSTTPSTSLLDIALP